MKKLARSLSLALAAVVALASLAACSGQSAGSSGSAVPSGAPSSSAASPASASETADTSTITDHAGRTVTIPSPANLSKVYVSSPIGFIFLYTLDFEKLAGTPMQFSDQELTYLNPACADMPYLGGQQMGGELNKEAIIEAGTQVFFSMGPSKPSETDISSADELQEQLGIPVVVVDTSMDNITEAYTFMGGLLGKEDRAAELAAYCTSVFDDVVAKVADIPDEDRVSVYYAEGEDGLSTEPETSSHAAALGYAGAVNVADVEATPGSGMSPVSLEQILAWNPDVIISWGAQRGGAYDTIRENADWASIAAVQTGRVYAMPNTPFSWMDRPPSVNRFLGIQWLANLLYPEVYDVDMVEVTTEFYKLFYSVELTEQQAKDLLDDAGGAG